MIKIDELEPSQLEQFYFYLRAEGFKIKIPELKEHTKALQTFYIKDNSLFLTGRTTPPKIYKLLDFEVKTGLIEIINNENVGDLQFYKRGIKIDYSKLDKTVTPYFIFSIYNKCDVFVIVKTEDPKSFILCQICSLIKFLKETLAQSKDKINTNVRKILNFDNVLKYPSMQEIDLESILNDILNFL